MTYKVRENGLGWTFIIIPTWVVKLLNLKKGQLLGVEVKNDKIILNPKPSGKEKFTRKITCFGKQPVVGLSPWIREHFNLKVGDRVNITVSGNKIVICPVKGQAEDGAQPF
jgi:antitoxin component of MazEF toxin-antitoxin module